MQSQAQMTVSRSQAASNRFRPPPSPRRIGRPALSRESVWRQPCTDDAGTPEGGIVASRWTDDRTTPRVEECPASAGCYVLGVALRPVRIRLGRGSDMAYEGMMPAGMVHVTEPGQAVEAEFFSACDFIHFHVAADFVRECHAATAAGSVPAGQELRNLLVRDELAAQLSRTLTEDAEGGDPLYAESVGQVVLMRVLARRPSASRVGKLPKWRLRRVHDHLAANLAEPISLADLAEAAGLSRMHFAAQFRAATGCRPHDYVLQYRIEQAKQMLTGTDMTLVNVALSVGFQTQSHFSTVFRRLTGSTPARWQRNHLGA